jgi:ribonuclease E
MGLKKRKMLISILPSELIEVVLVRDHMVEEYYVEMLTHSKTKRNIYKGIIHNIDASLQAAFVNYGDKKNGFLQIDEVHPDYYTADLKPPKGQKFPPIQRVLKPGQEILVQIVKEATEHKGAFLTTYLTLPGRYLVLTPGKEQIAISRKIEQEEERARLRMIMNEFNLEPGLGVIVRTVSEGQNKTNLFRDLQFLRRLWKDIKKRALEEKAPCLIYEEKDLAFRAIRDYLTSDVEDVWVDNAEIAHKLEEYINLVFPRRKNMVKCYVSKDKDLFEKFNVKEQIKKIFLRKVPLPSGGEIVIDQTEALTAIDINSGKISGESNFKDMAYKTNLEAVKEIAAQLKLRDIGGQIVIDFIEMKDRKYAREVEKQLKSYLKYDKARTAVGKISRFGLLEVVRQKMGSSAVSSIYKECPRCKGMGKIPSIEWRAAQVLKDIHRRISQIDSPNPLEYILEKELCLYLLNNKKQALLNMERKYHKKILIEEAQNVR